MCWVFLSPCTSGMQCTAREKEVYHGQSFVPDGSQTCNRVPSGMPFCNEIKTKYKDNAYMCNECDSGARAKGRADNPTLPQQSQTGSSGTQGPTATQSKTSAGQTGSPQLEIDTGPAAPPPGPKEVELDSGQIIPIRWRAVQHCKGDDALKVRYEKALRRPGNVPLTEPLTYENRAQFKERQKFF